MTNHNQLDELGFTLMELLIATAISMVILGAIAGTFMTQTKFYNAQEQVNEMQQNARAAMDLLNRDIKLAGYDPTDVAISGVTYSASELRIKADLDGDGAINDSSDEHVIYTFDNANKQIKRTYGGVGATPEVLANNIDSFTFGYLDSSGVATTSTGNIRQVSVSITARTAKPDPDLTTNNGYRTYTISNLITPPNLAF
jgi:type IV pilus assembly protein PilW